MTAAGDGCGRADCFACGLQGMGVDDDMMALILQLMNQAYIAGSAHTARNLLGPIGANIYGEARAAAGIWLGVTGDEVVRLYQRVIADRSMPMSPDVAEAARQHG